MFPLLCLSCKDIKFNKVDLPAPDSPNIKTRPLFGKVKLISFKALTRRDLFLYVLYIWDKVSMVLKFYK